MPSFRVWRRRCGRFRAATAPLARDLVAETEGAHRVPVDGVGRWSEVLEDMKTFNGIAHRRLARFAKVRRRNRNALARGLAEPNAGFDCGAGENFEFLDAAEGDGGDAATPPRKKIRGGKKAGDLNGDAPATESAEAEDPALGAEKTLAAAAAAAVAAAAAADGGDRGADVPAAGGAAARSGGEDPLMALALGGGDWQGGVAAAQGEPELVRLVSGGGQ